MPILLRKEFVMIQDTSEKFILVYTTQVNSAFRVHWFASLEVISQVLFTSEQPKKNKMASRFFVAVADIAAQIRHVNSLEAITDLHVCGSVLAPEILGT